LPGRLYSWIVAHHSVVPEFSDLPYVVGIVEFEPGVRMPGRVLVDAEDCVPDMPLDVTFKDVDASVSLPEFVPA
jgi:uncharacterized OB-fold protein